MEYALLKWQITGKSISLSNESAPTQQRQGSSSCVGLIAFYQIAAVTLTACFQFSGDSCNLQLQKEILAEQQSNIHISRLNFKFMEWQ